MIGCPSGIMAIYLCNFTFNILKIAQKHHMGEKNVGVENL